MTLCRLDVLLPLDGHMPAVQSFEILPAYEVLCILLVLQIRVPECQRGRFDRREDIAIAEILALSFLAAGLALLHDHRSSVLIDRLHRRVCRSGHFEIVGAEDAEAAGEGDVARACEAG